MRLEKNEPCPCGSGVKYRKCCKPLRTGRPEAPFAGGAAWRKAAWILLGLLALLYALSLRTYYVGYFNDDAFYLIGAKSLLMGRYANLQLPGSPPLIQYYPGYPLLLAAVLWAVGPNDTALKLVSLLMTWGAMFLIHRLWEEEPSPAVRFGALFLAGISPLTAALSGTVVAEVPYLLWTALVLSLARKGWEKTGVLWWVGVGALAGAGGLLRPNGIVLPLALAAGLALERRWRAAAAALLSGLAPAGAFLLRNQLSSGLGTTYFGELAAPFDQGGGVFALGRLMGLNAIFYSRELLARAFFRWPAALGQQGPEFFTMVLAGGALLAGLRRSRMDGWRKLPWLHFALYLGVVLAWFKQSDRYLLPLLPFAAILLLRGVEAFAQLLWPYSGSRAVIAVLACATCLSAVSLRLIVRASLFEHTAANSPPFKVFSWIIQRTRPTDVLAADMSGRLFIFTGRRAARLPRLRDASALADWAQAAEVSHILTLGGDAAMRTVTEDPRHDPVAQDALAEALSHSPRFEKVFEDAQESSAVFRLVPALSPGAPGTGRPGSPP